MHRHPTKHTHAYTHVSSLINSCQTQISAVESHFNRYAEGFISVLWPQSTTSELICQEPQSVAQLIFISALTSFVSSRRTRVRLIFPRRSASGERRYMHTACSCPVWIPTFISYLCAKLIFFLRPHSTHLYEPFIPPECWWLHTLTLSRLLAYSDQLRPSRKSHLWPHGRQRLQPERRGQLRLQSGLWNGGAHTCSVPGQPPVEPPASNV